MNILAIGDQHFTVSNTDEIECFMKELTNHLQNNKYDFIVSLGDLLHQHEKLNVYSLNRAIDYLNLLLSHTKTYVIVGNHDMVNSAQFLTDNHWLYSLKLLDKTNLVIVDKPIKEEINKVDFVFCPFVPDGRFVEALSRIDDWKSVNIIFAHQTVNGAKMGSIIASNVEEWKEEYPLCVSGHIHEQQEINDNFIYTGSLFPQVGDYNKRLLKIKVGEEIEYEDIKLKLIKKKTERVKLNDIYDWKYETKNNTKLKLQIECSTSEFKEFKKTNTYKTLIKDGIKVEPLICLDNVNRKEYKQTEKKSFIEILQESIKGNEKLEMLYKELIS